MRKGFTLGRAVTFAVAGMALLGVQPTSAQEMVRIGWPAGFASNMAHLTFAKELGIFKEENLDYEVISMQGTFPVVQQILSGGLHTGYVGVETVVNAAQPNATATPLRFIYNYTRQSIWEIVVPADSPIKDIKDLKGKTIGIAGPTFGNVPVTKAALGVVGVKPDEYTLFAVGTGATAFRALTTKQVDALNLWDTMHATLEASGFKLRRIPSPNEFESNPSHGFAVNEDLLKKNPDFVARFGRAIVKSIVACNANIEACIHSFWRAYPTQKPQGPEDVAMAREKKILGARLEKLLYIPAGAPKLIGGFTDAEWHSIIKALHLGGVITETNIPMNKLYSSALAEQYNKFDQAAIIARAKAAK
jgi:NitT/TauT family transport system substrate-binding protein